MMMSNFSKVDRPPLISNTPGGVWRIEKKRKARDKKNKQQKYFSKEKQNREDDDSVLVDIERDRVNDKECEDQVSYVLAEKKKSLHTKVDLKI
jgi:hypothetical protein